MHRYRHWVRCPRQLRCVLPHCIVFLVTYLYLPLGLAVIEEVATSGSRVQDLFRLMGLHGHYGSFYGREPAVAALVVLVLSLALLCWTPPRWLQVTAAAAARRSTKGRR